ncbi:murein L,D-transpeptidase [Apilactobacillus micheneri]|nr:murein L,D-transpeptidase [Apilactobacillus micheneri]TPR47558.1 murein L,D-transpeptidase [Apilactobacillus micheneri]TPR50677.1 murein L,D-transpeptidase [Apilactobacillus micheneri]
MLCINRNRYYYYNCSLYYLLLKRGNILKLLNKKKIALILSCFLTTLILISCGKATAKNNIKNGHFNIDERVEAKLQKIDWRKPSEKIPYPNMNPKKKNWLLVSSEHQRVYVMTPKNKLLYTMYCSTGSGNSATPKGTYHIQAERGNHFYNASSGEGANYWTSWKDHGIYLFHSVPVDKNGKYLMKDAHELGKKANSHGCIRLSVPDAKWINQHVPFGTKVVIK